MGWGIRWWIRLIVNDVRLTTTTKCSIKTAINIINYIFETVNNTIPSPKHAHLP